MASVAQACPLIGPVAVGAEDWPDHSGEADSAASTSTSKPTTAASAYTTIGWEVELWWKITDGLLLLHTNQLETLDPYGGSPIKSFLEVVCSHEDLVLLHLHTAHSNFPTDYFVYDCNLRGDHAIGLRRSRSDQEADQEAIKKQISCDRPRVHRLPAIKKPTLSRSIGLRRTNDGGYVAANFRQELDQEKLLPKTYLDCYYYPSNKDDGRWITREVEFLGVENLLIQQEDDCSAEEILFGWRTDLIIPFDDDKHKALLWVDFTRGILLCNDLLSSGVSDGKIKLHFVPHPLDLFPEGDLRWEHPHPYCSVGCSNGRLKLISLPSVKNNDACVVLTWTLDWDDHKWKEQKSRRLDYKRLLKNSKVPSHNWLQELPKLANNAPCYPILSTVPKLANKSSTILCLTLVIESKAWLLRINMDTRSLDSVADYPSFFDHMNPPYPCYLSKYPNEDDIRSSNPTTTHDMDQQNHPKHFRQYFKKISHKFKKWNPFIRIIL